MVARIARLHFRPAGTAGFLRAIVGWVIAIGGLVLIATQVGITAAGTLALVGRYEGKSSVSDLHSGQDRIEIGNGHELIVSAHFYDGSIVAWQPRSFRSTPTLSVFP